MEDRPDAELDTTDLPGLELTALTRWLDEAHPGLRQGDLAAAVIAGGRSNLTYRVGDGSHLWALRRPPLAHVLPTAHDMAREFRVISALADTDVPVARAIAHCADPDVLGAPFYLMDFVDGVVLDRSERIDALDPAIATRTGDLLADTLVALHRLRPEDVGLADFGRPQGFLDRQLRRWHQQWESSADPTGPLALEERVVDRLRRTRPESGPAAIVHGDYRLTNVIYGPDLDRIAAVVDWEMATVGDPLTDVGLLVVYHELALTSDLTMPIMRPDKGFRAPAEIAERYARAAGRDLDRLRWYTAFGYFKLAVVAEGIAARYRQGKTIGTGFADFGEHVPLLLDRAQQLLQEA